MPFLVASQLPRICVGPPPVLVLLHGYGADETDLMGLSRELDSRLEVQSWRAPHALPFGGYCWFEIEFEAGGGITGDERQAENSLDDLLEQLAALRSGREGLLILGGFSQGAMMSAAILERRPDLLNAAWLMSGRRLGSSREDLMPSRRPVLAQHGRFDPLISVSEGRDLADHLRRLGHLVEWREYSMAHEISYESLSDAGAWLETVLD